MSVQETNLKAIADAIRAVDGSKALIPAGQFKDRIALLANRMNVPLTVYVDAGAYVKVEQSGTILTAISGEDGSARLFLPQGGDWIVTAERDGITLLPKTVSIPLGYEESFSFETSRLPEGYTEVQYIACNTPTSGYAPYIVYNALMRKTINGKDYGLNAEAVFSYPEIPSGATYKNTNIVYTFDEKYGAVYVSYQLQCSIYGPAYTTEKLRNMHRYTTGIQSASGSPPGNFAEVTKGTPANSYNTRTKVTTKFKPESMKYNVYENDELIHDSGSSAVSLPLSHFSTTARYPANILGRSNVSAASNTFFGKLFSLRFFFEDGSIVGDLIPCKRNSDGMVGLYDLITEQFYPPAVNEAYVVAGPAV